MVRMSLQEIIDSGVDISDPANLNTFTFKTTLTFEKRPIPISVECIPGDILIDTSSDSGHEGGSTDPHFGDGKGKPDEVHVAAYVDHICEATEAAVDHICETAAEEIVENEIAEETEEAVAEEIAEETEGAVEEVTVEETEEAVTEEIAEDSEAEIDIETLVPRNVSYEEMSIEELQHCIYEKMRNNGPVTPEMKKTITDNVYHDSLVNWVKSFR